MRPIDADEFLSKIDPDEYYHTNEIRDMVADTLAAGNDPLTLEELREMDGEPVWIEYIPSPGEECAGLWALVSVDREYDEIFLLNSIGGSSSYEEAWPDIRAVYRRRPEEGDI